MGHNTFFASDHHFGHANILNFTRRDGSPVRSFDSVEEMDEAMIERHNAVVRNKDTCWFLGDVVINRRYLALIQRMKGRKRLILGNHDIFKNKDYLNAGFEDLHAFRKFDGFVATHIPVHSDSLGRWGVNVHGHLHTDRVMYEYDTGLGSTWHADYVRGPDPRYFCVCVEQINYTPISIEDLKVKINA